MGVGNGRLFFYNSSNRAGATGHITGSPTDSTQQGPGTFGQWSHVVGFKDGFIFFYNEQSKAGATAVVGGDGKLSTLNEQGPGVFADWTIITGV